MALDAFVKAIHDSLKKKASKIRVADLGTFLVVRKKPRTWVNPMTLKKIKIAAGNVPLFSGIWHAQAGGPQGSGLRIPMRGDSSSDPALYPAPKEPFVHCDHEGKEVGDCGGKQEKRWE